MTPTDSTSTKRSRLNAAVANSETPIFLLKANRQVSLFNFGCEKLTGWKSKEIIGKTCEYTSDLRNQSADALTNSLCPPPEVFEGKTVSVPAYLYHREGRSLPQLIHFFPLPDEQGIVRYVLGVMTSLTQTPRHTPQATPAQQLHAELNALHLSLRQRYNLQSFICQGHAMKRVLEQIQAAKQSAASVCFYGEPGTGKQHLARALHYTSETTHSSFVPLNCSEMPRWEIKQAVRRLLMPAESSETSVSDRKPGTLFLGHVEQLARDIQELLVEAYQSPKPPHIRLVCSNPRPLQEVVDDEELLPELFYLLTTLTISLPPLRHRKEDLKPLAQYFLEKGNPWDEKQISGFHPEVLKEFAAYNWPGNVGELATVIAEARESCTGSLILVEDLPFRFRTGVDAQEFGPPKQPPPLIPLEELLEQVEKEHIEKALERTKQNKSAAAELLGMTRQRIYRRMEALGIADYEDPSPS